MKRIPFRNNDCGAALAEFAVVAPMYFILVFSVIQTAYAVWIDNLLHYSVDVAARCVSVNSTTDPCANPATNTARSIFTSMAGSVAGSPTYTANCPSGLSGYTGTYTFSFLGIANLTLSARSCYPTYS
jgi:Flp pilus assembly protein TadG